MNQSSDAAEQLVRMTLNGVETAAKISGTGAKHVSVLLYAALQEQGKTKGKIRLNNMLKSGKELKVFAVRDGELQKFCTEAKKYGVLYCILKDKNSNDGLTDIMVRAEDASKINRIFERFSLATIDMASIQNEIDSYRADNSKEDTEKLLDILEGKHMADANFQTARTEKSRQSGHTSRQTEDRSSTGSDRPSVKKELAEIKSQQTKQHKHRERQKGIEK